MPLRPLRSLLAMPFPRYNFECVLASQLSVALVLLAHNAWIDAVIDQLARVIAFDSRLGQ